MHMTCQPDSLFYECARKAFLNFFNSIRMQFFELSIRVLLQITHFKIYPAPVLSGEHLSINSVT